MPDLFVPSDPDLIELRIPATLVRQPVGDMYIASMPHDVITRIAYFDVRRISKEEREIETYLGIQRPLDVRRSGEIGQYVNFTDASFPSSIIVAVDEGYARYDEGGFIVIRNYRDGETQPSTNIRDVARVLDGQHRIAGLEGFKGNRFDVIVTIFIGADISDQAYIFATVNLEQKKVSKSLAYDLFALAKSRSPQKTCHNMAVAFDQDAASPFFGRIKRLGTATPGRDFETISQATFVDSLLPYISLAPKADRDVLLRGRTLPNPTNAEIRKAIFRKMFVEGKDLDIALTVHEYFAAVRERWPMAWDATGLGYVLNRTNGFRALARFLRPAYLHYTMGKEVINRRQFGEILRKAKLKDDDFTTDNFPAGTSGEAALFNQLMVECGFRDEEPDLFEQ